jgi:hypothetical protein
VFSNVSLSFHRDQTRAWLYCRDGTCRFEVWIAAPAVRAAELEILFQSRSPDGWPMGSPRSLFRHRISLSSGEDKSLQRGRVTLPYRLPAELLQTCHWRVTPCTNLETTADESP